jgi:hypothetical protein
MTGHTLNVMSLVQRWTGFYITLRAKGVQKLRTKTSIKANRNTNHQSPLTKVKTTIIGMMRYYAPCALLKSTENREVFSDRY